MQMLHFLYVDFNGEKMINSTALACESVCSCNCHMYTSFAGILLLSWSQNSVCKMQLNMSYIWTNESVFTGKNMLKQNTTHLQFHIL